MTMCLESRHDDASALIRKDSEMTEQEKIDLEIRLLALRRMIVHIGRIACVTAGITAEHVMQERGAMREKLLRETWPGVEPAMGDHLSAELADELDGLFRALAKEIAQLMPPGRD